MRATDADDIKYLYASWKLKPSSLPFQVEADTPEEFTERALLQMAERYQVAYTLIAKPPGKEIMPVGIIFGVVPLRGKRILWTGDYTWFPWASNRNRLETAVHFGNQIRKEWVMIGFVDMVNVHLFEHVCRYGVGRRVGTLFDLDDSANAGPIAVFQTRKPFKPGEK